MANWDQAEGKLKEGTGKLTGDKGLEQEGEDQGTWGDAKEKAGDAKDKAGDAWDTTKDKVTGDED